MNLDVNTNENFDDSKEPPKEVAPPPRKSEVLPAIVADERGLLRGTNLDQEYRLAKAYCMSGLMPKGLNTPEKVLVGLQLCRELNLPPVTSLGKIMVFNGTPAIFGDLPPAVVFKSGKAEYILDSFEDKDGQPYAAVCRAKRKGMDMEITRRFTIDDAKRAGLMSKEPWQKYPRRMLQCRARAWVLKDLFPDVLSGVAIAEYDLNVTVENGQIVGESGETVAEKLNRAYLKEDEAQAQAGQKTPGGDPIETVPGVSGAVGSGAHPESGSGGG